MTIGFAWARAQAQAWAGRPGFLFAQRFSSSMLGWLPWVPVVIVVRDCLAEVTTIQGVSMHPFFNPESDQTLRRDLCLQWKWNAQQDLERGMIVVFWNPFKPESRSVKRVIGLEGDLVRQRNGTKQTLVPAGHIWVEGDAADPSKTLDSNTFGSISRRLVTGRLTHVLYPFNRSGKIAWWEHSNNPRVKKAIGEPDPVSLFTRRA